MIEFTFQCTNSLCPVDLVIDHSVQVLVVTCTYMYVHPVGIVRSGFFSNTMYKWLTCTFMWLGGV